MDQRRFTLRPQYEFTKSEPATKIQPEVTVNLGEILRSPSPATSKKSSSPTKPSAAPLPKCGLVAPPTRHFQIDCLRKTVPTLK
jgi:hypothetical protein